jgi:transcription termination factor NusB
VSNIDIRKKRELIVTIVYSLLVDPNQAKNKLVRLVSRETKVARSHVQDSMVSSEFILNELGNFSTILKQHICQHKSITTVSPVEKAVCLWAYYSFVNDIQSTKSLIISESLRMCNKFSLKENFNWVNPFLELLYASTNA